MFIKYSSDKIYELKINSDKFYPNHAEIEFRIRILINHVVTLILMHSLVSL